MVANHKWRMHVHFGGKPFACPFAFMVKTYYVNLPNKLFTSEEAHAWPIVTQMLTNK